MARQAYRPALCLHTTGTFYPLIPLFPQIFSAPNHLDTPFPHLWFLPKCCIISCLSKCSSPSYHGASYPLSPKGALALTHRGGFHAWTKGLRQACEEPRDGVASSEPIIYVPVCFRPPVLLWVCGDEPHGLLAPVMAWEQLGVLLVLFGLPPTALSLCVTFWGC